MQESFLCLFLSLMWTLTRVGLAVSNINYSMLFLLGLWLCSLHTLYAGAICFICKQTPAANNYDTLAPEIPWRDCNAVKIPKPDFSAPVRQCEQFMYNWHTVASNLTPLFIMNTVICKLKARESKMFVVVAGISMPCLCICMSLVWSHTKRHTC